MYKNMGKIHMMLVEKHFLLDLYSIQEQDETAWNQ